jgi:hypothetical protein
MLPPPAVLEVNVELLRDRLRQLAPRVPVARRESVTMPLGLEAQLLAGPAVTPAAAVAVRVIWVTAAVLPMRTDPLVPEAQVVMQIIRVVTAAAPKMELELELPERPRAAAVAVAKPLRRTPGLT